ncbi:ABC transporter ATP-binding protein [Microbispora sp. NBC_01189]|uniref:ABC transporter ATP-binding protein n=1 Tax=Microbispora sp. NBC_01189 TaxID=2903583 RepID=UPI002E0DAFFE|nr:ABC transporter ATP-binding protein [Microbispora sp. NBC_01189]
MDIVIITADELYRFYRAGEEETRALRGVSLEIEPGEVVAVTGPSGSGKSTLLACLAGLDDPDGGMVRIAGERISHRPDAERAALRARLVGVMFQSGNLVEHLTVAQNVELAQRLARRRDRSWRDAVLARLGLDGRAQARPSELSGGETARAGLAVALANRPALLLADEPTGELDEQTERRVLALLRDQAGERTGVVVASHSPAVRRVADRVIRLRDGRLA